MSTTETQSAIQIFVPTAPDATSALGALRLGAYRDLEDGWVSKSIPVGDGIYLMTSSCATTNVDGGTYIHAGNGMNVLGDNSVSITNAGETSVRAATVSFAANETPETSGGGVNMQAGSDVTLKSGGDFSIDCETLVYVVNQHFSSITSGSGVDVTQGAISVTVGGLICISPMASIGIGTVGVETGIMSMGVSVISIAAVGAELSGALCEMQNHGLRAFMVGIAVPFSAVEANANGASNNNSSVSVSDIDIQAEENGAQNDSNLIDSHAQSIVSNV